MAGGAAMSDVVWLSLLGATAVSALTCGQQLLNVDFNRYPGAPTPYTRNRLQGDWGAGLQNWALGAPDRAWVGDGVLQVLQPKGCLHPAGCGLNFNVDLARQLQSATLSYRVKFQAGYTFAKGGKLPGMCDQDCPTGCVSVTQTSGWSTRVMFREGGALESYMYHPGMTSPTGCGVDWAWNRAAAPGAWYTVTLFIQMNTPGQPDGEQRVWLNGDLVLSRSNVVFQGQDGHLISRFTFSNFHGGSTLDFAPDHDQYIWLDDFVLSEGKCPPSGSGSASPPAVARTPPLLAVARPPPMLAVARPPPMLAVDKPPPTTSGCGARRCGWSWDDANRTCQRACPRNTNDECVGLGSCWSNLAPCSTCSSAPQTGLTGCGTRRCGYSWDDANRSCKRACPRNTNEECAGLGSCWSDLVPCKACAQGRK